MIAIPIILGIYLVNRFQSGGKVWLIGAATFIISQVFHLPFNSYILNPIIGIIQQTVQGVPGNLLVALLLGLSAGVFEELARYGMFRWWLKDNHSWRTAIMAGAGHGGIEAILLGGIVMLAFLNMVVLRNSDLSNLNLTPDQLEITRQQVQAYWSTPWYDTLFGAIERAFTIPFHMMASVLVLQVFTRRPGQQRFGWLGLAILLHTMMDASAVFIAGQWSGYAAEAMLAILAIVDIIIIFALRQPEPTITPPAIEANQPPTFMPEPVEETPENLDKTRFQ
ncbi:MAG: YhfC family glutamic-type intramembrane protease [Anaerolineales bacterium]